MKFHRRDLSRALVAIVCILTVASQLRSQFPQSAAQLLKDGTYYHSIDDMSDRAGDRYRQIIRQFPKSKEAEQAQFYLGTYYQKKFYILEHTNRVQDWSSFNEAEGALNGYITKYSVSGYKTHLSDAYYTLAMIALRRGDSKTAAYQLDQMQRQAPKDSSVTIYKVVWSPSDQDVIKKDCDSRELAAATLQLSSKTGDFNEIVYVLKEWCNQKCRPY